jgi:FAD/FMN-containing dehydrogenase/Fe-S oxidoreductase
MTTSELNAKLLGLQSLFGGDIFIDETSRTIYSTDASAYKEKPVAVVRPKDDDDIRLLVQFAGQEKIPLIPRAAGTSLAGQVVGSGIIVDVSKYMTQILEVNEKEHWVRVQPGVVLDELNKALEPEGLFFGPETSTSNRCMIGGMVGNNSCGAHSIIYGSTRDHTLEIKGYLSDGNEVVFKSINKKEFEDKCALDNLEGDIYRNIRTILSDPLNQKNINEQYPRPDIKRRNTGYAIDLLLDTEVFNEHSDVPFNFCKLLAGSEGTLVFITEIVLNLVPLPPKEKGLLCIHCETLEDAFTGNLVALEYNPDSVELIDHVIIECTRDNIEQRRNRFFIEGQPEAILIVEFARESMVEIISLAGQLEKAMREKNLGYHFPLITGPQMNKVWALRKAGLGLLSNVPGDAKPVTVIEDTAVHPSDLPAYMVDFKEILKANDLECVYYAHIATGELHLKPVLDLKDPEDVKRFRTIGAEIARLVKKYKGSLSGEHGDGRLRGEFIPFMIGEQNYKLLQQIKATWDPGNVFNPGKITMTPPMDRFLRYEPGTKVKDIKTYFDYSKTKGILRAVEKCNGSGDCRKSEVIGGTMCPSYMATKDEDKTTRARANMLREILSHSDKENPFDHEELKSILDLCLSCKGCKSECPSNVDMAKYKAEFLQHYQDAHGVAMRTWMIANITKLNRLGSLLPGLFNFMVSNKLTSGLIKKISGFAPQRRIPALHKQTLQGWLRKNHRSTVRERRGKVYFFADEFTSYNDVPIGIVAIQLLQKLGYEVVVLRHRESGRTYISKGLLKRARRLAEENVDLLKGLITAETPLVGIEPSALLTFRDEYPELVSSDRVESAVELGNNCLLIEEFISREFEKAKFDRNLFTSERGKILLHGHCQQKSIASTEPVKKMLQIPENYKVEEIKSGCCGMAGSFGYEKEHYELSMKIGELVLFPAVRNAAEDVIIAAPGTSCRQQIKEGCGKIPLHPVEVLYRAMNQ